MGLFRKSGDLQHCMAMALIWLIDMQRSDIKAETKKKIAKEGKFIRDEIEKEIDAAYG